MDRKSILKKFEDELRQARKNFREGKGIPLEKFDWAKSLLFVNHGKIIKDRTLLRNSIFFRYRQFAYFY